VDARLVQALRAHDSTLRECASFFETYALHCEAELREMISGGEEEPEDLPGRELVFERDPLHETTMFDLQENAWRFVGEAACAYQEAARFGLLFDQAYGRRQLAAAAVRYLALGVPYGYFLQLLAHEVSEPAWIYRGPVRLLIQLVQPDERPREEERRPLLGEALATSTQQAYLFLVAASHPSVVREYRPLFGELSEGLQARGATPVGPQSVPLSTYWRIGQLLVAVHNSDEAARDELVAEISDLARLQGQSLRQAQLNEYQWEQLTAPVDLVDLDLAGIAMASAAAIRRAQLRSMDLEDDRFADVPELGLLSVAVGLDLGRESHRG
jgi:hypothetical protein